MEMDPSPSVSNTGFTIYWQLSVVCTIWTWWVCSSTSKDLHEHTFTHLDKNRFKIP